MSAHNRKWGLNRIKFLMAVAILLLTHTMCLSPRELHIAGPGLDKEAKSDSQTGQTRFPSAQHRPSKNIIAAGESHTMALKRDGSLWAWGANGSGQLGEGTYTYRSAPVRIGADADWVAVAVGAEHSVALKRDGSLWTWGSSRFGLLGDGTDDLFGSKNRPVRIGNEHNWTAIAAGTRHSVALKRDGSLWAWGDNYFGQLGDGTTENRTVPVRVGSDYSWAAIAAGGAYTLALKRDGSLWTWGSSYYRPVRVGTADDWAAIAAGGSISLKEVAGNALALKRDGSLWHLTKDSSGPSSDVSSASKIKAVRLGTHDDWAAVATAFSHTVALKKDGSLWTWGSNLYGQLGDGTGEDSNEPVLIGTDNSWTAIAAGAAYTVALKADGTLWAWGHNATGQLGVGTTGNSIPGRIGTANDWTDVAVGTKHTLALKSDGGLWAWGLNLSGQLGNGTTKLQRTVPGRIGTDRDWAALSGGDAHTLALKKDGSLWAWGENSSGQLGDGSTQRKMAPGRIGTDRDWAAIAAGRSLTKDPVTGYTLALKRDGSLWAWGYNTAAQLGDGTTDHKLSPVRVGGGNLWMAVAAGGGHTLAIKSDGSLWAWGDNLFGQLGPQPGFVPVRVGTDTNWGFAP